MARNPKRLTILELVVTIAVVALLAGVVVPMLGDVEQEARTKDLLAVIDRLETACRRFHADTGRFAAEAVAPGGSAERFDLSRDPGLTGWRGPYIEVALGTPDNPFGGSVELHGRLDDGGLSPHLSCFYLEGEKGPAKSGAGNYAAWTRVPQPIAHRIDRLLDAGIAGSWMVHGRVQWLPEQDGTLLIFLAAD